MNCRHWLLAVASVCVVIVGLVGLDRRLSRGDRLVAAQRELAFYQVRDQALRYELERGALPDTLKDLVPAYLRADQLETNGKSLYLYDPNGRTLAQAEGDSIRGLVRRTRPPMSVALERPEGGRAPLKLEKVETPRPALITPQAPAVPEVPGAPEGSYVFEAEHFTDMNYGWEIHPDPECAGGAYLHAKEGMGNGSGQAEYGVGDFYNVRGTTEITQLRYHIHLPQEGRYYVYGRLYTTAVPCSNYLMVSVDRGGPEIGGMGNKSPFRWHLSSMHRSPVKLVAGDHFLHVFMHEDGIRMDQFLFSPVPIPKAARGGKVFRANLTPGDGTAWKAKDGPSLQLLFDLKSMVITPKTPPECKVALRRLRRTEGEAELRVVLEDAGPEQREVCLLEGGLDLGKLPEVSFVAIDFSRARLADLPPREYLLRAELTSGGKQLASTHIPLMRPFSWEVSRQMDFLPNEEPGPLDGDLNGNRPDDAKWAPLKVTSWDHLGVMDFGLHTIGNSLHAPQSTMVYAQTRIRVPEDGDYLLKVQADDQMLLWLDGKEIYRHDHMRPVTRAAYRRRVHLRAGERRIRIRVNQNEGRWQASLRIRTQEDDLSGVTGLPLSE